MARRLKAMGQPSYANGFKVTVHPHLVGLPLAWKQPQMVFVNSMSDLFHEDVPEGFIVQVFQVMQKADWHQYQILTKRSDRLLELAPRLPWEPHIWMGVSVENEQFTFRIDHLRQTAARIKFVSFEPLLGPIPRLDLTGIDWVIVGGESGPGARPIDRSWVADIRDQCRAARIPFFFKQWGGIHRKENGRTLDGRIWDERPDPYGHARPEELGSSRQLDGRHGRQVQEDVCAKGEGTPAGC
jgi:protein gp37